MIIVTGGYGFIGSNIIKNLNNKGLQNIIVIDNLENGYKFKNLVNSKIINYFDKNIELMTLKKEIFDHHNISPEKITAVFHQGACSATTQWDGKYMMNNNFECSKKWLHFCVQYKIPFIYASSAAVYGNSNKFIENEKYEKPVNIYGYSKLIFDQYVRRIIPIAQSQIVGLRYFNVYGPHEDHKKGMSSVAYHHYQEFKKNKTLTLFGAYDNYESGQQMRDFISVDDVAKVNMWFLENPNVSGIFNCGTGKAKTFNCVANTILQYFACGKINYIKFPEKLKKHYQSYTEADITKLRNVGCSLHFRSVEDGIKDYLIWLEENG